MTFAKPKTVTNQLFQQLEQLFRSDATPDQFTLAKLEREANALQNAEPDQAMMVKAGIAALKWDVETAKYWLNNALRLSRDVPNLLNAALTYKMLNQIESAADLSLQCYALAPKDKAVVTPTLDYLTWTGQFAEASRVFSQAKLDGNTLNPDLLDFSAFASAISELGIDPERVRFETASAHSVLAKHQKRIRALGVNVFEDHDHSLSLVIEFGFYGNLADELKLESDLAQLLAGRPGWNPSLLTTELTYEVQDANEFA